MTFKIKNTLIITGEEPAICEDCGRFEELRPYGKNGANVCFRCAMKDEANAAKMFKKRTQGDA